MKSRIVLSLVAVCLSAGSRSLEAAERAERVSPTPLPAGDFVGPKPSSTEASESAGGLLDEVLRRVEENASALQAARANHLSRREARRAVWAQYLGEVDGFIRDMHFDDKRLVNPLVPPLRVDSLPFDRNQFAPGLEATVPVDVNGRISAAVKGARFEERAAGMDVEDLRLRLLNAAAGLFRGIQRVAGLRDALVEQRRALEAHIRVARQGVRAGRIAPVERWRLASELERVKGELATLMGSEADLRARLAALLRAPEFSRPIPLPTVDPRGSEIESPGGAARPDVVSKRFQTMAAAASVRRARAERWPELVATSELERNAGYHTEGQTTWFFGFQLRMPFWDGGRRRAQVGEAKARHRAALHLEDQALDDATAQIASARANWKAAEERAAAARSGLSYARETRRIQARRFEAGRLSAADLVDAEAELARARGELTSSLVDWWRADDDLNLAMGRAPMGYQGRSTSNRATAKATLP